MLSAILMNINSSLKQFQSSSHFNIHRKLLLFNELINIPALFTAKELGMLKELLLTAIGMPLCK